MGISGKKAKDRISLLGRYGLRIRKQVVYDVERTCLAIVNNLLLIRKSEEWEVPFFVAFPHIGGAASRRTPPLPYKGYSSKA